MEFTIREVFTLQTALLGYSVQRTLLWYFVFISLASVAAAWYDKFAARRGLRRVPEAELLFLCVLGGSLAMYPALFLLHHKTRHKKFTIGIPVILAVQVFLALYLVYGSPLHG